MKKTKRRGRRNSVAIDRLSTLPDDVLTHMLSFLSTKEAIQTSILAKRWRNIWASMPVLKFNLNEFLRDSSDLDDDEKRNECEDKFEQFVNGVLENREPSNLDIFHYYRSIDENYSDASMEWIDRVALLMPRVMSVRIYRENVLDNIPDLVFSCTSLQQLELSLYTDYHKTIIRPKSINLPSLKVLELRSLDLDDDFAQKLFLGCPSLESLYLGFCDLGFSNISSKVLKTLAFEECVQADQMQICCPSLVSLDIDSNDQERGISLKNTTSLANADIKLDTEEFLFDDDLDILGGVSNVSTLKLTLWCAELKEKLEKYIPYCKNFNNLKTLELGRLNLKDSNLVAFFLRRSPHLQKLTLNIAAQSEGDPEEPSKEESGEVFRREYLETVKIIKWKACKTIKWKRLDPLLHQVIKYLRAHIKKIGKIMTT